MLSVNYYRGHWKAEVLFNNSSKEISMLIDTGAAYTVVQWMTLIMRYPKLSRKRDEIKQQKPITLNIADGLKIKLYLVEIPNVKIGDLSISKMKVATSPTYLNLTNVIGMDFISSFSEIHAKQYGTLELIDFKQSSLALNQSGRDFVSYSSIVMSESNDISMMYNAAMMGNKIDNL